MFTAMTTTTIDLLRHGECEGGRIFRGTTNVKLSTEGWQNMQSKLDWLKSKNNNEPCWDVIVSSTLDRCKLFSSNIANNEGVLLQLDSNLREVYFGDWEGQLVDDVYRQDRKAVEDWHNDPVRNLPANAESTEVFYDRVVCGFQNCIERNKGKRVLLVSHGGVMKAILASVLAMPLASMNRLDLPYACLSRVEIFHDENGDYTRLTYHNVTV